MLWFRIVEGINEEEVAHLFGNLSKLVVSEEVASIPESTMMALRRLNYTVERLMLDVMRPCKDMLKTCTWSGVVIPCDQLFPVSTTSDGFCCSFNYRPDFNPDTMWVLFFRFIHINMINSRLVTQHLNSLKIGTFQLIGWQVLVHRPVWMWSFMFHRRITCPTLNRSMAYRFSCMVTIRFRWHRTG